MNLFTFVKEVILFFFLPSRTRNDRKTSISISTKGARTVRIYVVMTQLRSRKVQGHPEETCTISRTPAGLISFFFSFNAHRSFQREVVFEIYGMFEVES